MSVLHEFQYPILPPGGRHPALPTPFRLGTVPMSMPEASVNKDCPVTPAIRDVERTGKVSVGYSVGNTHLSQQVADL